MIIILLNVDLQQLVSIKYDMKQFLLEFISIYFTHITLRFKIWSWKNWLVESSFDFRTSEL